MTNLTSSAFNSFRLFSAPSPGKNHEDGDFLKDLNRQSLSVLTNAYVEPSLISAKPGDTFQFERLGYFCMDRSMDSVKADSMIFNRVVTLKDTWAVDTGMLREMSGNFASFYSF